MNKIDTSAEQPPAAKRAKVDTTASTLTENAYVSHPCGLDADLWLQIASGLEFGEIFQFTVACKLFYKEVAPMIEKIKVMSSACNGELRWSVQPCQRDACVPGSHQVGYRHSPTTTNQ